MSSILSVSFLENKFLTIPNPKDAILWRTTADDSLKMIQRVQYAFPRPSRRSRNGKPISSKTMDVHLWKKPLNGWVPQEFDYIAIVERGLDLVWCVKSVETTMEGVLYICPCEQSSIPSELVSTITQYVQSGRSTLVQY